MARMIPPLPKEFDPKSDEGYVFDLLKNKLSDDYYVFHSVSATVVKDGTIYEREIDFVIAHKDHGIMCLEAKNGANLNYINRTWTYGSGIPMSHGGPYLQIASAKRTIIDKIKCHGNEDVRALHKKCKVCHSVFFFKMHESRFEQLRRQGLPEECDRRITLLADDIVNLESAINHAFAVKLPSDKFSSMNHRLTDDEFQLLLDSVLCPAFNLIPSPEAKGIAMLEGMNQLLREQFRLLDFLEEQDSAVINGAAGTGKTMVAVEKARRHSVNGEKVLFLCYNRLLCESLIEKHKKSQSKRYREEFSNVDFMTISRLAKEKTGNFKDFDGLLNWICECIGNPNDLGYKHIIIDEGQDFGLVDSELGTSMADAKNHCSIVDALQEAALSCGGTFYLFYDKYQMIQGGESKDYCLPDCILNCDCRLTLTRNCRNTKEIAKTSVTPLRTDKFKAIKPTVASSWFEPEVPVMHLVQDDLTAINTLNGVIDKYRNQGIKDIVILTPGTMDFCCIADKLAKGTGSEDSYYYYHYKDYDYKVSTCKKFKGLEADAVVVLDLKKDSFLGKKGLNFYVGTSRAKLRLDLVCNLTDKDYFDVVHGLDPNAPNKSDVAKMQKILSNTFAAEIAVGN